MKYVNVLIVNWAHTFCSDCFVHRFIKSPNPERTNKWCIPVDSVRAFSGPPFTLESWHLTVILRKALE